MDLEVGKGLETGRDLEAGRILEAARIPEVARRGLHRRGQRQTTKYPANCWNHCLEAGKTLEAARILEARVREPQCDGFERKTLEVGET